MNELSDLDSLFLKAVANELLSARKKFPATKAVLAAFGEESGEVFKSMLGYDYGKVPAYEVWMECVQAAAMACRIAVEGDPNHKYLPPTRENYPNDIDLYFSYLRHAPC